MGLADAIEAQFGFELPDRVTGKVFPAMATFPYRRLRDFDVGRNLVVRLNSKGLDVLQQHVSVADWHDETELRKVLRLAGEQWGQRSGVAATRLYLVVEHGLDARVAGRVRRIAMTSGAWRVVGSPLSCIDPLPGFGSAFSGGRGHLQLACMVRPWPCFGPAL